MRVSHISITEFLVVKGDATEVMVEQPSRMLIYVLHQRSND